jgi:hypothetical protein
MPPEDSSLETRIISAAYEERVKELFKIFTEAFYIGESEKVTVDRFRRGLLSAKKVRELAMETAKQALNSASQPAAHSSTDNAKTMLS